MVNWRWRAKWGRVKPQHPNVRDLKSSNHMLRYVIRLIKLLEEICNRVSFQTLRQVW